MVAENIFRLEKKTTKNSSNFCLNKCKSELLILLWLSIILLLFPEPGFGIRLTKVRHLFDLTDGLHMPSDVSVSEKDGRIFVVDGVNHKIRIFNQKGKLVSSFGSEGSANGQFKFPLGIDIDRSGKVYIADSGNHRVQIFNLQGSFIAQIRIPPKNNHLADPTDVGVDVSRNRCYVVDNDNHYILAYNLSTRKLIKTYGTAGTDKRAFRYPFLIALDKDKYLYIVDVINTRVQVLNPDGQFVAFIGEWGVEKGELFRPKGVAIDKKNRVYVSDSYMGVIQVFNANGEFYAALGGPENGTVKKFRTPTGIFIDGQNRLYVAEMLGKKVSVYQIEGETE
jgi:DNA-binding beta-propeller fold protein YncE